MNLRLDRLERDLGYTFEDQELLRTAVTHRSAGSRNNERLEFLGDAVLGVVIAESLFERFSEADEGQLSRLRSSLVKGESLGDLARGMNLGDHLILGSGEMRSGGQSRTSILADGLEAVFGAVFREAGFEQARKVILKVFAERLEKTTLKATEKDAKTRLQEYLQGRHLPLPSYQVLEITGAAHAQTFRVRCDIEGLLSEVLGVGSSRRRAEQDAADRALEQLLS